MGASIFYQSVHGKCLNVGAPSYFLGVLRRVFGGDGPWEVDGTWSQQLQGAAAASSNQEQAALEELIEAIERYGRIRIWAEY